MYRKIILLVSLIHLATSQICDTGNIYCNQYQQYTPVPHADRVCCNGTFANVLSGTCTCGSEPCNFCDVSVYMPTRVQQYIPTSGAICYLMSDNFCQSNVVSNVTFMDNATACQSQPNLPYYHTGATNYVVQCSGIYINIQACKSDGCPVCSDLFPVPQGYCNTNNAIWGPSFVCYCAGYVGGPLNTPPQPLGPRTSDGHLTEEPSFWALLILAFISGTIIYFFD
jgi:hypothetical protein